jgi:molybdate transport system substrate-binding protein
MFLLIPSVLTLCVMAGPVGCGRSEAKTTERPVVVFAAASTAHVVGPLLRAFEAEHRIELRLNAAASSTLARQIQQGAPADIFLSANTRWMDQLAQEDLLKPDSRTDLLGNRLAVVRPLPEGRGRMDVARRAVGADATITPAELTRLLGFLRSGGQRLALGNPDHVPAGMYARSALQAMDLWDQARPHIAPAKDVRSALMLVEQGEAALGIVYHTDARSSVAVRMLGVIAQANHPPIRYPVALTRDAGPKAEQVLNWLTGSAAQQAFEQAGFVWQLGHAATPQLNAGEPG